MYLAHYDAEGNVLGFYKQGMHTDIPEPTLEISEEEHQEYFGKNQSYKVIDGKWTYIEPQQPTAVEIKQQKISVLDAEYQPKFAELSMALGMATLADNTALITSIKVDYVALKTEYDTKRGEIDG